MRSARREAPFSSACWSACSRPSAHDRLRRHRAWLRLLRRHEAPLRLVPEALLAQVTSQRTNSRTIPYTVASSCSELCDMQAVCVLLAPDKATLESGLITSSHGDQNVP